MNLFKSFQTLFDSSTSDLPQQSTLSTKQGQKLLQLTYHDRACAHRLIEYERRKNPTKPEEYLCQDAIDRLIRDRQ
jgi:hypothetical protein